MARLRKSIHALFMITALFAGAAVAAESGITAARVPGSGPILDHESMFWKEAVPFTVSMLPQTVATPYHPDPAIKTLTVRAVHNGAWLGVLVEWPDETKSDSIVTDRFGDQVAVQFPVAYKKDELPSPMMGSPGRRVNIWQWRAAFQHDLDAGELKIRDLYPNILADIYPSDVLQATDARPYLGAVGVDNLISHPHGSPPVLEQIAEGFGTLTVEAEEQSADGRGVWEEGRWRVVFTHPLTSFSKNSAHFILGDETVAAFAVWEGGRREVGSRKAWSAWVPFRIAK